MGMGLWAFGVPLTFVSALGLLLNVYILLVVVLTKQAQTANTVLLLHLGAVETALCLVLLVFTTGGSEWPALEVPCAVHGFLLAVLHPVALWTVTGLNCDRYYAIASPLHYAALVSPRRATFGLGAAWTGAVLLCLPPLTGLVPPYRYSPGLGWCAPDLSDETWGAAATWYGAVYVLFGIVLPAVLVTACNLRVLSIARYHRHRIASAIYEVTLSAQVTITHQRNPFSFVPNVTAPSAGGPPRFHSAATTVVQLVGSLYLLYFPYCGLMVWDVCETTSDSHGHTDANKISYAGTHVHFSSIAALLLACSPPVNGLLYGLKSRTLRRSVKNYWRKKATKSELQQEIQARTPSMAGSRRASINLPAAPLFPLPPLQRRLSDALLGLASTSCGSGKRNAMNKSSQLPRLHPAASCNTLRVPHSDSGGVPIRRPELVVRTSASAATLTSSTYSSRTNGNRGETLGRRSPRILITRANSEDSQKGVASPLLPRPFASCSTAPVLDKQRWQQRYLGSDSSNESSLGGVWTTGVSSRMTKTNDNRGKTVVEESHVRILEEGAICGTATLGTKALAVGHCHDTENEEENGEASETESSCTCSNSAEEDERHRVLMRKKKGEQYNHKKMDAIRNEGEQKTPLLTHDSCKDELQGRSFHSAWSVMKIT